MADGFLLLAFKENRMNVSKDCYFVMQMLIDIKIALIQQCILNYL